jgi:3-phosphoshikimate 1-carboxyvinyltransferase
MKISITPRKLKGTIWVPPSKSQAHRLIIGAALADGVSHLSNLAESQDIRATLNCMQCLGASVSQDGSEITGVRLGQDRGPLPVLDCGESGSTIRFLMPVALAVAGGGVFLGRGRLLERPYGPYEAIFQQQGITFQRQPDSITLSGALKPGRFEVPGDVSSQFITGLLYALPLLDGESEIVLTTALESRGYVDLTLEALKQFGVQVSFTEHGWQVPGGQRYQSADVAVEGDYSQAANFILAASLGNPLQVEGLRPDSAQGDRIVCQYAALLDGAGEVTLDVSQCPDLVPALAVRAALRDGAVTRIVGAARLRLKESDRLDAVTVELNRLGGQVEQTADTLTIRGVKQFHGGSCNCHQDHRIAMMLAVAATCASGVVEVNGAEHVAKSYPTFWEDYKLLGGQFCQTM